MLTVRTAGPYPQGMDWRLQLLIFKQRLDKSPGSCTAKTTCSSSAFLKPAQGQDNNKWDPSIKRRTAQSGLFGLSAPRTAPSHANMSLWSSKYCASATVQHMCISLHTGESKAIPSSCSTLMSLLPTLETEGYRG